MSPFINNPLHCKMMDFKLFRDDFITISSNNSFLWSWLMSFLFRCLSSCQDVDTQMNGSQHQNSKRSALIMVLKTNYCCAFHYNHLTANNWLNDYIIQSVNLSWSELCPDFIESSIEFWSNEENYRIWKLRDLW